MKVTRLTKDEGKPQEGKAKEVTMAKPARQPKSEKVPKNEKEEAAQLKVKATSTPKGRTQYELECEQMTQADPKSVEMSKSQDECRDPSDTNLQGKDTKEVEKEENTKLGEDRETTSPEDGESEADESVESGNYDCSVSGDDSTAGLSVLKILEDEESGNENETVPSIQESVHASGCNNDATGIYKKADEHLKKGEYQEAGRLYKKVLPLTMNEHGQNDKIIGDIHVKLAAVYQSKGKLKASVDHLTSAREIYENVLEGDSKSSNEHAPKLKSKIIDILKTIASLQVATEQVEDADKSYKSVLKACKKHYENDEMKLAEALNNYGNFQSVCQSKDNLALETFKKALKVLTQHKKIGPSSASTLNNMGHVYLRLSKASNGSEGQKDAKRAEACFLKALQLYRKSMTTSTSGNEKVTEVSFNLAQARLWQQERKGILRNVRFGETVMSDTYDSTSREDSDIGDSQDSYSDGTYSVDDDETFDGIQDEGCFAFCY